MARTEPIYEKCNSCGSRGKLTEDSIWTCDGCGECIGDDYLTTNTFRQHTGVVTHFDFCSWRCALEKLRNSDSNYFVDLPKLHYDVPEDSPVHARRFFELLVQP